MLNHSIGLHPDQLHVALYVPKPVSAIDVTKVIHDQRMKWLENLEGRYKLAGTMTEFAKLSVEREKVGKMFETIYSEVDKLFNS